jgi:terminase small subunit / prophage DNA-packing protein
VFDFNEVITQSAFGLMVGISQPAVSDLMRRGVLLESQPASVWLRAYCSHLREQAAGRATTGDLDLATERAALARAQREKIEMQNAVTRKELAPAYLLEEIIAAAGTRMGAIFDGIPGSIRRRNQNLTSTDIEVIATEIAKARNIAAAMTLDELIDNAASEADATDTPTLESAE